jgi:phosphatidylinositol alpha 1,6-mannosyltransferase
MEHLEQEGHEATLVCPDPAPASFAGFEVTPVKSVTLSGFNVGIGSKRKAKKHLESFEPDVVHIASPFGSLGKAAIKATEDLDIASVAIYQTDIPRYAMRAGYPSLATLAEKRVADLHNRATVTLAPSTSSINDLMVYGVEESKIHLWRRGVDANHFTNDRRNTQQVQTLKQQLAPKGEVLILYVGRLAPEKRVERLSSLAGIANTKLVIVGDGPSRKNIENALGNQVNFMGEQRGHALADVYAACDIFVHSGTEETFGQTLQEAKASGLPVVAPASGGPIDIINSGVNGYLYAPESNLEMRTAVELLVKNVDLRQTMSQNARESVMYTSWDSLGRQLIDHYRQAISIKLTKDIGAVAFSGVESTFN